MSAKVFRLDDYRPCEACGGTRGAHSNICPLRMSTEESWATWKCPCKTVEEHQEHIDHLVRVSRTARESRERNRAGIQRLIDALNLDGDR